MQALAICCVLYGAAVGRGSWGRRCSQLRVDGGGRAARGAARRRCRDGRAAAGWATRYAALKRGFAVVRAQPLA